MTKSDDIFPKKNFFSLDIILVLKKNLGLREKISLFQGLPGPKKVGNP